MKKTRDSARRGGPVLDFAVIMVVARQEFVVSIRNRWTVIFAVLFGVLVLGISYFGLVTAGTTGFQGFTRTTASLLNLVLYIVPLVALSMGCLSFASESGSGELLFSQPVTRSEILLGKLAGLSFSIATATILGFGMAGVVIAMKAGSTGASRYPALVALSLLLAIAFLSISALISTACHRRSQSFGVALFAWFFFVLFYDLLIIGVTFLLKERIANQFILASLFGNPVGMVRVAGLMSLDGKEIFGAAGAALARSLGGELASIGLLVTGLLVWVTLPVVIAQRLLRRQDI